MAGNEAAFAGENSPEQVAFKLMETISRVERKSLSGRDTSSAEWSSADRIWILNTFAECLDAVKGRRDWTRDSAT